MSSTSTPAMLVALMGASALGAAGATLYLRPAPAAPPVCSCQCASTPVAQAPTTPGACKGMTWSLLKQEKNIVRVGSDPQHTDAYRGDTTCQASLSVLCINPKNLPKPEGVASDFYSGWSGAEIAATKPLPGMTLTSRAVADAKCAEAFGAGWRMAEHHDGHGGWGLAGVGELPHDERFWVAIDDQPANPWDRR